LSTETFSEYCVPNVTIDLKSINPFNYTAPLSLVNINLHNFMILSTSLHMFSANFDIIHCTVYTEQGNHDIKYTYLIYSTTTYTLLIHITYIPSWVYVPLNGTIITGRVGSEDHWNPQRSWLELFFSSKKWLL